MRLMKGGSGGNSTYTINYKPIGKYFDYGIICYYDINMNLIRKWYKSNYIIIHKTNNFYYL